jgi:hypothetical protein
LEKERMLVGEEKWTKERLGERKRNWMDEGRWEKKSCEGKKEKKMRKDESCKRRLGGRKK